MSLKKCPKCGSTNGYEYVLVMHYTMTGCWGEDAETSGKEWNEPLPKSVRCANCKARIPFTKANGAEEASR